MRIPILIAALLAGGASLTAAEPVLELTVGDESYVGCAVAHNDHVCWLAHADGRLSELSIPDVTSYRKVSDEFRGLTPLEARNQLRKQLGAKWHIVGTGHYLVCATTDGGRAYAQHFEDLYRSFRSYFTKRGFELPQPEFPLIAIVFANRDDFAAQCRKDDLTWHSSLRGYYHRRTNRICLYEQDDTFVLHEPGRLTSPFGAAVGGTHIRLGDLGGSVDASIQGSLKDTIVHEATHQLAFNLGLHSRIGHPPRWVVEGLATMFEADGVRRNTGSSAARQRVNEERFWWFNLYQNQRREPGSLTTFLSSEDHLGGSVLDFYAQAWALTFFLAETRPRGYTEYLQLIADRDPLLPYTASERLRDFQSVFGNDVPRLEVDMLRFISDLQ